MCGFFFKPTDVASSYSKGFSDMISTVSCTVLAKFRKKSQEHCRKSILIGLLTSFQNTQQDTTKPFNDSMPLKTKKTQEPEGRKEGRKERRRTRPHIKSNNPHLTRGEVIQIWHLKDLLCGTLHPQPWLCITTGHLRRFKQQKQHPFLPTKFGRLFSRQFSRSGLFSVFFLLCFLARHYLEEAVKAKGMTYFIRMPGGHMVLWLACCDSWRLWLWETHFHRLHFQFPPKKKHSFSGFSQGVGHLKEQAQQPW